MATKKYLYECDALNGKEGSGFATIDGNVIEIFRFRNFNLKASFDEVPFKVVGTIKKQKKTTGIELSGSFVVYMGMSEWADIVNKYLKTGKCTYFELQITNDDPNVTIGGQTLAIHKVKITEADLIKLDADADFLDQSVSFTCLDFDVLEAFNLPAEVGLSDF